MREEKKANAEALERRGHCDPIDDRCGSKRAIAAVLEVANDEARGTVVGVAMFTCLRRRS